MQSFAASTATVRDFALLFSVLIAALGCGRGHAEASHVSDPAAAAPSPPVVVTDKVEAAQNVADSNASEDDEWVPMTGSEQVIVGDLGGLTDGAPVQADAAEGEDRAVRGAPADVRR